MSTARRVLAGAALLLASCATASADEAAWYRAQNDVAEQCAAGDRDVSVTTTPGDRPQVRYESHAARQRFRACFEAEMSTRAAALRRSTGTLAPFAGAPTASVPLEARGPALVARATVNGRGVARLVLDTGASLTILTPAAAERLGITVPSGARRLTVYGLGSDKHLVPVVRLTSLELGGFTVSDIEVGVYTTHAGILDVDGLLGTDFLGHFQITVDRQGPQLMLGVPPR